MTKELDLQDITISEQERELEELRDCQYQLKNDVHELVCKEEGNNEMNLQLTDTSEQLLVRDNTYSYSVGIVNFMKILLPGVRIKQCI